MRSGSAGEIPSHVRFVRYGEAMADHAEKNRRKTRSTGTGPPGDEAGFEQLSLDATITGPGKHIEDLFEPGTPLKIKGERGIYTYRHATISSEGLVSLHLVGDHTFRAVRPEQVSVVKKGRRAR